jgi:formate hydrogenlyase subunit 3/multisubunit Na+/H+ antiporter MnhD subunit
VALATLTVGVGLFPAVLLDLSTRAAEQLLDPSAYMEAVLQAQLPIPEKP